MLSGPTLAEAVAGPVRTLHRRNRRFRAHAAPRRSPSLVRIRRRGGRRSRARPAPRTTLSVIPHPQRHAQPVARREAPGAPNPPCARVVCAAPRWGRLRARVSIAIRHTRETRMICGDRIQVVTLEAQSPFDADPGPPPGLHHRCRSASTNTKESHDNCDISRSCRNPRDACPRGNRADCDPRCGSTAISDEREHRFAEVPRGVDQERVDCSHRRHVEPSRQSSDARRLRRRSSRRAPGTH